jgi:hypothetical protein
VAETYAEVFARFERIFAAATGAPDPQLAAVRALALEHLGYTAESTSGRSTHGLVAELITSWRQELGRRGDAATDLARHRREDLLVLTRHVQDAVGCPPERIVPDDFEPDVDLIRAMVDGLRVERQKAERELQTLRQRIGLDEMLSTIARLKRLVGNEDVGSNWDCIDRHEAIRQAEQFFAEVEALRNDRSIMWELFKRAVRMYRETDEQAMAEWRAESSRHETEVEQLRAERDRLRQELDLGRTPAPARAWRTQLEDRFRDVLLRRWLTDAQRDALLDQLMDAVSADVEFVDVAFGFDGSRADGGIVVVVMPSTDAAELDRLRHELAGAMAAIAVAVELSVDHDPDELIEALAGVVAERDELRGELALILKPGQRVRVGRHLGTVHRRLYETTPVQLDGAPQVTVFDTRYVQGIVDDEPAEAVSTDG